MPPIITRFFALLALASALAFPQGPVDRPQPNEPSYGVAELQQFPTYTRESYRAKFGAAAPACDPGRPVKTWFDRTVDLDAPDDVTIYRVIGRDAKGAAAIKQLVLRNAEAAAVNLPGREQYPAYRAAPTTASVVGNDGTVVSGIDPNLLAKEDQAKRFAALFGGTYAEETRQAFPYFFPPQESRRIWIVFDAAGTRYYAGELLAQENRAGVGAPGGWVHTSTGWIWLPDPVFDCSGHADERPVPIRALFPNEQLSATLMGSQIVRTDKQQALDQAAGNFTAEDRALLRAIADKLGVAYMVTVK